MPKSNKQKPKDRRHPRSRPTRKPSKTKSDKRKPDGSFPSISVLRAFVAMVKAFKKPRKLATLERDTGISRQGNMKTLNELQKRYGCGPLLQKTKISGQYEVTADGRELFKHAKRVLLAHGRVTAWPPGGGKADRIVRIGTGNAVMRYFLPAHTERLLNTPGPDSMSVRVVESHSSERMRRDLRMGKLHIGIEGIPAEDDGRIRRPRSSPHKELEYCVLREAQLYSTIVVGHNDSLPSSKSPLTLTEVASLSEKVPLYFVAGQQVQVLRRLRSLRNDCPNVARRVGVMSTLDAVLTCVREGPGIGFVSAFLRDEAEKSKGEIVVRSLEPEAESLFEQLYLGVWWRKSDIAWRINQPEESRVHDPVLMLLRSLGVDLKAVSTH